MAQPLHTVTEYLNFSMVINSACPDYAYQKYPILLVLFNFSEKLVQSQYYENKTLNITLAVISKFLWGERVLGFFFSVFKNKTHVSLLFLFWFVLLLLSNSYFLSLHFLPRAGRLKNNYQRLRKDIIALGSPYFNFFNALDYLQHMKFY